MSNVNGWRPAIWSATYVVDRFRGPATRWNHDTNPMSGLVEALQAAGSGDTVYVHDDATISISPEDLESLPEPDFAKVRLVIGSGVTLISGRGNRAKGGLIHLQSPWGGDRYGLLLVENGARLSGLRIKGPSRTGTDPEENVGVYVNGGGQVDFCDLFLWADALIRCVRLRRESSSQLIDHNFLHDVERTRRDGDYAVGYGVVSHAGQRIITHNVFDKCRHCVASGGSRSSNYRALYNHTSPAQYAHEIDVHAHRAPDGTGAQFPANRETIIEYNTCLRDGINVNIRGTPEKLASIQFNRFANTVELDNGSNHGAVKLATHTRVDLDNNQLGFTFRSRSVGTVVIESVNEPGHYIKVDPDNLFAVLAPEQTEWSLFRMGEGLVPGLHNYSFESVPLANYYLRENGTFRGLRRKVHQITLDQFVPADHQYNADPSFAEDATFVKVDGLANSAQDSFRLLRSPTYYLRHKYGHIHKDTMLPSNQRDGTFVVRWVDRMGQPLTPGVYRIQQLDTRRYLDARRDAHGGHDYSAVTRPFADDNTQKWVVGALGDDKYTIQQVNTRRYLDARRDAHDGHDWSAVTRPFADDNTQKWVILALGDGTHTIQQLDTRRFLDARRDSHDGHDWSAVTRKAQDNATQRWVLDFVE